jgi:3-methyl-2-oxobutanoate hydroxymethyltransferase
MSTKPEKPQRLTVPAFAAMKSAGRKISMLTAYDFSMAEMLDDSGVDAILVGDSMSMVVQGHENTLSVTLDEMIYHAEMVGRAVQRALVVVDLPFPCCHLGVANAVESAGRILKQTNCQAVKLEGGAEQAGVITGLVSAGIPVMAHVGLRPQSVHQLGIYRVQKDEVTLMSDAQAAEEAGAFSIVLECITSGIAEKITKKLRIPTIGIGAGATCDGQILVIQDLLGITGGRVPKHVKKYAELRVTITDSVNRYCQEVRDGQFPGPDQTFH